MAVAMATSAGCDRALVYGDRSGLNIAIRSDPAEGAPLEVNTGFQRRVVGFVPAKGRTADGKADGEAVDMASRYDMRRTAGEKGPFSDKIEIKTAFASGKAANAARDDPKVAEAILSAPQFAISNDPGERAVNNALIMYVSQSISNAEAYLALARAGNLRVYPGATATTSAYGTITDGKNAAGNAQISQMLKK